MSTAVYIEMPNHVFYVFHFFEWKQPKLFRNDAVDFEVFQPVNFIEATLLFEANDKTYTVPMEQSVLQSNDYSVQRMLQGNHQAWIANIQYPFGSTNQRGMVIYQPSFGFNQYTIASYFTYISNRFPYRFPYQNVEENLFSKNTYIKQHYTSLDVPEF